VTDLDLARRVNQLETELAAWKTYAAELERGARPDEDVRVPPSWGLTRKERGILMAIYQAGDFPISRERIQERVHGRSVAQDAKCIDVVLVRVRRKLAPLGVVILSDHGSGWHMPKSSRDLIAAGLLSPAGGPAA
jgi:DNA-binding response OmpR family regulator